MGLGRSRDTNGRRALLKKALVLNVRDLKESHTVLGREVDALKIYELKAEAEVERLSPTTELKLRSFDRRS
ncbi:hypothetical protein ACOSQ2_032368 [Xanthoceras sorbifolium]